MNKAKELICDLNGDMYRNTRYIHKDNILKCNVEGFKFDAKFRIKRVGWQNSGVYFELEDKDNKIMYMSDCEFIKYIEKNDLCLEGTFEFLKQGTIQSLGICEN